MTAPDATEQMLLVSDLLIESSHPSLDGHFPGNPVVPGVLLLDTVLAAVERRRPGFALARIPAVKFLSPLLPDEAFSIRIEFAGAEARFECFTAARALARGSLRADEGRGGG